MKVGIIAAMPAELKTAIGQKLRQGEIREINRNLIACCSGIGPKQSAASTSKLLESGAEGIILWGTCVALVSALKPGMLVIATGIQAEQGTIYRTQPDSGYLETALSGKLEIKTENLAESSILLCSPKEKKDLAIKTNAVAAEMEGASVAVICRNAGIPFIMIKAVLDTYEMELPGWMPAAIRADGSIPASKLISTLIQHPRDIFKLIKIGKCYKKALLALNDAALLLEWQRVFLNTKKID